MVFCTECGKENPNESLYCYNCGTKLTQTDVVGDINTSINCSGNENVNYQNKEYFEKPLIKKDETQKGSKNLLISIIDATNEISLVLFLVSLAVGFLFVYIPFIGQHLSNIIVNTSAISCIIFLVIVVVSSAISNRLKRRFRQKIIQTGIPAQAHVIGVDNLEYDHHSGIRTAELTLEVYSKTDTPYKAKSTVKVGVSDASLIFPPGKTVKVFIDPEDASQVEVKY